MDIKKLSHSSMVPSVFGVSCALDVLTFPWRLDKSYIFLLLFMEQWQLVSRNQQHGLMSRNHMSGLMLNQSRLVCFSLIFYASSAVFLCNLPHFHLVLVKTVISRLCDKMPTMYFFVIFLRVTALESIAFPICRLICSFFLMCLRIPFKS